MIDLEPRRIKVLLVDDDIQQLELRAIVLRMSGFSVAIAGDPFEAISVMTHEMAEKVDVAILDYEMPLMNGSVLADYLRFRFPTLKIILHSGCLEIPENEVKSFDAFIPKCCGLDQLLSQITEFGQVSASDSDALGFRDEIQTTVEAN